MVKQRLKNALIYLIKRLSGISVDSQKMSPFPFIQNINRDLTQIKQPKALISYITEPFSKNIEGKSFHTNQKEAIQLLKVFLKYNFAVDICHCLEEQALNSISQKKYDLVFGFGKPFVEACKANPTAIKFIYCTEAFPDFVKQQEQKRLDYYFERYGKKITVSRHGKFYIPEHFNYADYLLYKGNSVTGDTFKHLKNISKQFPIAPAPFLNSNYKFEARDHVQTKKCFVWFGSYGAVHKGLDILVDVFNKHPELQLIVCGLWKEEIELLPILNENIVVKGFMDTSSDEFINVVNSSSFVILPTCSEGMSAGVLTCMCHGLIPIVSRESGIDLDNEEQYLEDFHVDYIEKEVIKWTNTRDELLSVLHKTTFEKTRSQFNLNVFTDCFERHLLNITNLKSIDV